MRKDITFGLITIMKQEWKDFLTQTTFHTLITYITNQHHIEQENLTHYQKYRLEMEFIVHRLVMLSWRTTNHIQQLKHLYLIKKI